MTNLGRFENVIEKYRDFSISLFQLKRSIFLSPRSIALASRTTLKAIELLVESSMPVLQTTSPFRIYPQARPHSPNRDFGTFSFAVEYRSNN